MTMNMRDSGQQHPILYDIAHNNATLITQQIFAQCTLLTLDGL